MTQKYHLLYVSNMYICNRKVLSRGLNCWIRLKIKKSILYILKVKPGDIPSGRASSELDVSSELHGETVVTKRNG